MRIRKSFIVGLIIGIFVLNSAGIVFATDNVSFSVAPTAKTVNNGDTVELLIKLDGVEDKNKGVTGFSAYIGYEEDKVEISQVEAGSSNWQSQGFNSSTGMFAYTNLDTTGAMAGNIAKIKLKVLNIKAGESTKVTFKSVVYSDVNDEDYAYSDLNVTLTGTNSQLNTEVSSSDGNEVEKTSRRLTYVATGGAVLLTIGVGIFVYTRFFKTRLK